MNSKGCLYLKASGLCELSQKGVEVLEGTNAYVCLRFQLNSLAHECADSNQQNNFNS